MFESPPAPEISTGEVAPAIEGGATVIDVREPDEFATGHIPRARPMPLGEVLELTTKLDPSKPVYVICAVGGRSMAAAGALRQLGFDAISITGGTSAWASEGRPIATGSSQSWGANRPAESGSTSC